MSLLLRVEYSLGTLWLSVPGTVRKSLVTEKVAKTLNGIIEYSAVLVFLVEVGITRNTLGF